MSEYTKAFERTRTRFGTAGLRLEEMYRRRDRKRRNEKIGAIVLALIIAIASTAAILSTIGGSRGPQPASPTITPGNASTLQLRWTAALGEAGPAPVVADGVVVGETRSGQILAFPDRCAGDGGACAPLWRASIDRMDAETDRADRTITWWPRTPGNPGEGNVAAFTAADGVVYAASKTGKIYAFDVHCGVNGQTCLPMWTGQVVHGDQPPVSTAPPTVENGFVLAGGENGTFAFHVGCGAGGASCTPAWHIPQVGFFRVQGNFLYGTSWSPGTGRTNERAYAFDATTGKMIWHSDEVSCCSNDSTPAQYGDTVYVNFGREIDAFPVDCRGSCRPIWTAPIIDRFSSPPVVTGNVVAVTVATDGSTGGVLSWPVDCATGGRTCHEQHRAQGFSELTSVGPQAFGDRLYTESLRGEGTYVFDASCLAKRNDCRPVWADATAITPWEMAVQDGVAYQTDSSQGVAAYDAACPHAPCLPLWHSSQVPTSRPTIDGDEVLFTGYDGVIYAYAPGEPASTPSKTGAAWFYGMVALVGLAIVASRIFRRRRLA
jgi:nitrite reductase/ring-hydroxylating ferredoxin subunit